MAPPTMTSAIHRVAAFLRRVPFAERLIARLPETAQGVLHDLREAAANPVVEVHRGEIGDGEHVRATAFSIGRVAEGGSVRAVDVLRGAVDGGSARAVNLLVGDVLHGDVRAVNVLVGDVRGGTLRDVHLIVGDIWGGRIENCYAVLGDIHGGEGRVSRVIGRVLHDGIEVGEQIDPE